MHLDAALPPVHLRHVPEIARAAEALGFTALWSTETQHDPFLPQALIAEHTRRMQLGTAIAVAFARSPANLAYIAWDLAAQSNGRFILGLGTQVRAHIERRFGLPWPESPVGKMREQIQAMRAFWDCWQNGTKLDYRGEYYKLSLMSPFFNPGPLPSPSGDAARMRSELPSPSGGGAGMRSELPSPSGDGARMRSELPSPSRDGAGMMSELPSPKGEGAGMRSHETLIPIYLAGVNTGLARLAGELCEGFLVHPLNSPRYLKEVILPAIHAGERKAGSGKPRTVISVTAFAASTPEEQNFARAQVAFYASTPSYRPVMALHGWQAVAERLSAHAAHGEWGEMFGLVTDDILAAFCVTAPEAGLAQALQERYAGLADRLTLYIPFTPGERDGFWREMVKAF